jgi:uncharacterized protein (TIGR01627 family)
MRKFLKRQMRYFFARPSSELARSWPSHFNLSVMRRLNQIQLGVEQIALISKTIKANSRCRLLIFGLGNDSLFWSSLNREGVTISLEDDPQWLEKITKSRSHLTAFRVTYGTRRTDWKWLLDSPSSLQMALPRDVEKTKWDVILVDGPAGWGDDTPGRMKSIYAASRLAAKSADIFAHDCEREVEDAYCKYFLKNENMKAEVKHPEGWLRHYHMLDHTTLTGSAEEKPSEAATVSAMA